MLQVLSEVAFVEVSVEVGVWVGVTATVPFVSIFGSSFPITATSHSDSSGIRSYS
jgi:hypothetical protein